MAVGRIGDVVWAFRYVHPDVEVPSAALAYHSGGFYEVVPALLLLALVLLALVLWLRRRVGPSGVLLFAVVGAYSLGRFAMFFWRSDSAPALLGLDGGPGHEPDTRRSLPLEPTAREPFVPSSGSQASDTR